MDETFLFIDTETTGFKKSGPLIQEGQARVCQIAMLLTDSNGKSLAEFSALIKPDGWQIGEGAAKVHGFTNDLCEKYGINFKSAVAFYSRMVGMASQVIAHNSEFDRSMMEIEEEYSVNVATDIGFRYTTSKQWFCTMKTNTHIKNGKWPKLTEALQHYCGRASTENAHDAMYDVRDCRDIFFAMREKSLV